MCQHFVIPTGAAHVGAMRVVLRQRGCQELWERAVRPEKRPLTEMHTGEYCDRALDDRITKRKWNDNGK